MLLDGRAFQRDPLTFLRNLKSRQPVIEFRAGLARFTLVTDPSLIQRVLVSDRDKFGEGKWTRRGRFLMGDCLITREGPDHHERRRLMQPVFSRSRMQERAPRLIGCVEAWASERLDGEQDDGHSLHGDVALAAVCEALFEFDVRQSSSALRSLSLAVATVVEAIPHLPLTRPRALLATRRLHRLAREMRDGELSSVLRRAGCSEAEVRREAVSMLIAGVDTTPRALSRLWFELAKRPDLEDRLHQEVDDLWAGTDQLTVMDLEGLEFTQSLLLETQRLYPAVRFVDRRPLMDLELGGVRIKKDADLLICPLLAHRDPEVFDRADEFDPDRWVKGKERPRFSFLPFGEGPHRCIGEWLARMTMPATVAHLARHFRVSCQPPQGHNEQVTHFPVTLKRRNGSS